MGVLKIACSGSRFYRWDKSNFLSWEGIHIDADGTWVGWPRLLLAIVLANAADLDMIPGILVGEPNRYHHVGFSHSLLFAVAAFWLDTKRSRV